MTDTDNGLLDELNGKVKTDAATPQEAKELEDAAKEAAANPLEVVAVSPKTAPPKAMAEMKEKAGPGAVRGYAVTVAGKYAAPSVDVPGKKLAKDYRIVVNLASLESALSTIKNKMLDKMLKMKYQDYVTYLTHEIVDVKPLTPDTPESNNVAYMSVEALLAFIKHRDVPVDPKDYDGGRDARNIRAAVTDFLLNPKGFKEREERRLASIAEDRALAAMNPELDAPATASVEGADGR